MDIGQLWRLLDNEVTRGSACVISVANLSLAAGAKVAAGGGGHDGEGRPFNSGPEPLPPKKRSALGHLLLLSLNLSFHKWDAGKRRGPGGGNGCTCTLLCPGTLSLLHLKLHARPLVQNKTKRGRRVRVLKKGSAVPLHQHRDARLLA